MTRTKSKLHDIKDMSPNVAVVAHLEALIKEAKKGELRSIVYAVQYQHQGTSNGWVFDYRGNKKLLCFETGLLNHHLMCKLNEA